MPTFELAATLALGLVAGLHHAASGPDHLAGVAPLAAGSESAGRGAWRIGVAWGLGHALGTCVAALLALALRSSFIGFEQRIAAVSERLVAGLLCAIGFFGLVSVVRRRAETQPHEHPRVDGNARQRRSAFYLGCFHGAAGLAHVFAVLPALALPGTALPALYLGGYAAGSLAAIVLFASAIGRLGRIRGIAHGWLAATSAASLAVGAWWFAR